MTPRLLYSVALLLGLSLLHHVHAEISPTCSVEDENELDPDLVETTIDFGEFLGGKQTHLVYVQPDVTTFYKGTPPAQTAAIPKHNGFSSKFINLSNQDLQLYWEPSPGGTPSAMWRAPPFSCGGTASFPTHRFYYTSRDDRSKIVKRFEVGEYPENINVYDPFTVEGDEEATMENLKVLSPQELELYKVLRRTVLFNEHYLNVTGRSYLVNYYRKPSTHFMWRAEQFGQEHWVTTKETHFVELPPEQKLNPIRERGTQRILKERDPRILSEYRTPNQDMMNMTLKVISCAPRAFEIPDFLSEVEVAHVLQLAAGIDLKLSGVGMDDGDKEDRKHRTRTSYNSWVERERSPIIDAIYRRAADLLRMDEALLRNRDKSEMPQRDTTRTISEALQLVHYDLTQEYTAHHDYGFSDANNQEQNARFATLLLYLNEGMEGGETAFPRWVNAETFQQLKVTPKVGKAVLFYSQLPDGNMDDFSHHAALPIIKGEKWLINLWVWDPAYKH